LLLGLQRLIEVDHREYPPEFDANVKEFRVLFHINWTFWTWFMRKTGMMGLQTRWRERISTITR